jgi:restriction system protein
MPIPFFQELMLPILNIAAEKGTEDFSNKELQEKLSQIFQLTEDEKNEMLSSGKQKVIINRIAWAVIHLKRAGLIDSERRGYYKITPKGIQVVKQKPETVNLKFLEQFDTYKEWRSGFESKNGKAKIILKDEENSTPQELMVSAYAISRADLASQLKEKLRHCSPEFFEMLVVDLLVKMGYGGSLADAGKAVGKSGDGGIDGIIKEDKLGLDTIYIQAKRWTDTTVGRPDIQQFAGALQAQRANKGVFLTTAKFSKEALDYVTKIGSKIVLIDGEQLAELMIDNNLGVSIEKTYEIKKIDSDYFVEE